MAVDKRYEFHLAAGSGHHHSSCWRSWISKVSGIVGIPKLGAVQSFNWMGYLVMWTYRFPAIYITCQCGLISFFFCFVFSNSFRLVPSALTSCRGSFSPLSLLSSISLIGGRTFSSKTKTIEDALLANWQLPGHLILYLFIFFVHTFGENYPARENCVIHLSSLSIVLAVVKNLRTKKSRSFYIFIHIHNGITIITN